MHEFHDFAAEDGINSPANHLDVYIGVDRTDGFALMSIQDQLSNTLSEELATLYAGVFALVIGNIGWTATQAYLPDVYIGSDFTRSDRQKSLAYHEFAHASHYTQVGMVYWLRLVTATILANGHGDEDSFDAGIISVCESWAGYIGSFTYTHRTYGTNNSIGQNWEITLDETWHESANHIPIGLYHDLIDEGIEPQSCDEDDVNEEFCTTLPDFVSGFTNAQFFSCLTTETSTIEAFRGCLISNYLGSTSNTEEQTNSLFAAY